MNQKNPVSCRCICRKLRVGQSSWNDITYFSHECCNEGSLEEAALLGLEVSWLSFLEVKFPLDARVTSIVLDLLVLYDSAVGPSDQARDIALLGEEKRADSNLRKSDYQE